jgi:hypothetical protein
MTTTIALEGHQLHAALLALRHPVSGAPLALAASLPSWARGAEAAVEAAREAWVAAAAAQRAHGSVFGHA